MQTYLTYSLVNNKQKGEEWSCVRRLIISQIKEERVQLPHHFFPLALEQSISRFASLLTRQKEPSQGSGSQGIFIELSGLHGRRGGMCQRENASLIKACSEMWSYFCQTLSKMRVWNKTIALTKAPCVLCCSKLACSSTHSHSSAPTQVNGLHCTLAHFSLLLLFLYSSI